MRSISPVVRTDQYSEQGDDRSISSNVFSRYADGTESLTHEDEGDRPDYANADKEHTMYCYREYKAFSGRLAQDQERGNDCRVEMCLVPMARPGWPSPSTGANNDDRVCHAEGECR